MIIRFVTICSNAIGVKPLKKVNRCSKGLDVVQVSQPNIKNEYNNGMGGVDLIDRALSDYRPFIKGKKWYWTLLVNALNISAVFTWRMHSLIHPEIKRP